MKRTVGAMALTAAMSGCVAMEQGGTYMSQVYNSPVTSQNGIHNGVYRAQAMAGVQGPYGQPIATFGASADLPKNEADAAARATLAKSVPPEIFQQVVGKMDGRGQGIVPVSGVCPPGGCPPGGGMPGAMVPGMMPPAIPGGPPMLSPPGAVAAVGALTGARGPFRVQRTEVRFVSPAGMKISWFVPGAGTRGASPHYLEAPGRYNFVQAAIYRLKLSDIPNRPGVELYPTLEVVPAGARAQAFLADTAVPVSFTEEDFEQVAAGNFVVKVIYLPDPQFQDLAATGPDEVVSSRLEPGQDPIAEAHRRGSILLVIRLGNIDLEAPDTPAMDAPSAYQRGTLPQMMPGMMPPAMMAGRVPPQPAVPPKQIIPPGNIPPAPKVPGAVPQGMLPPGNMVPAVPSTGKTPPILPAIPTGPGPGPAVPATRQSPVIPAGPASSASPTSQAPADSDSYPLVTTAAATEQNTGPPRKRSILDLFSKSH